MQNERVMPLVTLMVVLVLTEHTKTSEHLNNATGQSNNPMKRTTRKPFGKRRKTIIHWTNWYFGRPPVELNSDYNCTHMNMKGSCIMTTDRSQYMTAKGFMFHLWFDGWANITQPEQRFSWQHYLGYTIEAAARTCYRSDVFQHQILPIISRPGFFNLTSTFRSDSDFSIPYLYFEKRHSPNIQLPAESEIMKRKKLMVWFVSHCKTDSRREEYIAEISKHIHVDIYGKCTDQNSCGRNHWTNCTEVLIEDYKFYFAGENSICREYFTEKLLRPLQSKVVPVVYGSDDVYKVAPPHSYIDVRDFKSPQHLAKYLIYLNKNHTAYMSYFLWKKHYQVFRGTYSYNHIFCLFCNFLHTSNKTRILEDFNDWFFEKSGCKETDLLSFS